VNKAEEVFDVILPPIHEATEVMHPCKEPFHFPSSAIAAQAATVLRIVLSAAAVGSDHLDAVLGGEFFVERVRVVSFVANESFWEFVEEASGQNIFHKSALGWRSSVDSNGERKTVISGDSDDLGPLATTGWTDREAPFLALANVASTKASSRFSRPCYAAVGPIASAPVPVYRCVPTAGIGGGKSGMADIAPAVPATAHRCLKSITLRSIPRDYHATAGHDYQPSGLRAAPARQLTTVHPLTPTVRP
jgi:hypothetical protein